MDFPVKVENIYVVYAPVFGMAPGYTISINGEQVFGLPMGPDEVKECFETIVDMIKEHDGYFSPDWL